MHLSNPRNITEKCRKSNREFRTLLPSPNPLTLCTEQGKEETVFRMPMVEIPRTKMHNAAGEKIEISSGSTIELLPYNPAAHYGARNTCLSRATYLILLRKIGTPGPHKVTRILRARNGKILVSITVGQREMYFGSHNFRKAK